MKLRCNVFLSIASNNSSFCKAKSVSYTHLDVYKRQLVTDAKDMQTDLKNVLFYWEEKVSETSFIPHELKHLPVKRGTATVNIKFDGVKQVEVCLLYTSRCV